MRVGSAAHVHVEGFTCVSRGLRAHSGVNVRTHNVAGGSLPPWPGTRQCARATHTPGNCPKRRPLRPQQCFSTVFWRGGLRFGRHTTSNSARAAAKRGGNCIIRAATRRRYAASQLLMLQNPHRYQCRARCRGRGPGWGTGGWRKPRNCTHHQVPRRNKSRPTRTTPRRFGTKLSLHARPRRISGIKLSLLTRNGSIWRNLRMRGEFCTVFTTKKPSRENFVPNAGQRWG